MNYPNKNTIGELRWDLHLQRLSSAVATGDLVLTQSVDEGVEARPGSGSLLSVEDTHGSVDSGHPGQKSPQQQSRLPVEPVQS